MMSTASALSTVHEAGSSGRSTPGIATGRQGVFAGLKRGWVCIDQRPPFRVSMIRSA